MTGACDQPDRPQHGLPRKVDRAYSGVLLTRRIAGFFEEVPAFVGAEQGADIAQGGPERLERARGRATQQRFQLGEGVLDRVVMTTLDCWFVLRPERG